MSSAAKMRICSLSVLLAIVAALVDRLLHHCHVVNIRGNSYRIRGNSYRMREHQQWLRSAAEKRREGVAR